MKKRLTTIVCLTTLVTMLCAGTAIKALAFSDELEPIYPNITAVTRSTEEIFQRMTGPDVPLAEGVAEQRRQMIEMYKSVGLDVTLDMEHWGGSERMIAEYPQRWSTETPIPLGTSPDYSEAFSIDAPWNNKIPADAPRMELSRNSLSFLTHFGLAKTNLDDGGYGTGPAQVVGYSTDPEYTIMCKYYNAELSTTLKMHVPVNVLDLVNQPVQGDEHTVFIDGDLHTSTQAWKTRSPGDHRGYSIDNYLLPFVDIRCHTLADETRLDGIGAEGRSGANAAKLPTNAFTIKSSEISSPTELINHALGGAIAQTCGARVYPATWTDAHMAMSGANQGSNGEWNRGVVPYGGVIQLDPEIDLEAIYNAGKLSWHGYRILKAMQDYGYYNIDTTGRTIHFYTSTVSKDWVDPDNRTFDVPVRNNQQGFVAVCQEIEEFMKGNEIFGLKEQPKAYLTVPVAKYADLDVNDDGAIDQADHDLVLENINNAYTDANKQYDVNQDKEINFADVEIMNNYLNDMPIHSLPYYDISVQDNDAEHGQIIISGPTVTVDGIKRYREGFYTSVAAIPANGYEFAGWTGDFAGETDNVVKVVMDKDYTVGAKYKKKAEVKFTVKVSGPGHVEVSEDNLSYDAPPSKYGINTLIKAKAVADEGYAFLGWYGDATGYSTTLDYLVSKDTELIALFGEKEYTEQFKKDDWELIQGSDKYIITEGKSIQMKDFDTSFHVLAKKKTAKDQADLTGNFKLRATLTSGAVLPTHPGLIFFNFKDAKNYYYLRVDGNGQISLYKNYKGIKTELKKSEKYPIGDGVKFELPMTVEIVRNGSFITVNSYKNGKVLEYFKVRDKSLSGGRYGVGSQHHAYMTFTDIKVSTSIPDPSKAKLQTWVKTVATDAWTEKLKGAVVVKADNDKAYTKDDYQTISGGIKPYLADDGETVYVPLRYIVENLGGTVSWDAATDHVVATLGDVSGSFKDGENGAQEKNGTLYVPAQALADGIGKKLYKYRDVVFFSDTAELYNPNNENECVSFIEKAFGVKYEIF